MTVYHIQSSLWGLLEVTTPKISVPQLCSSIIYVLSRILSNVARGTRLPLIIMNRNWISWVQCCCCFFGHINNTSDLLYWCLIKQTLIQRILSASLSKQSSKIISTFKLIFCLLDHFLLNHKTLHVIQVQLCLWSLNQDKGLMKLIINLIIWVQTLRELTCIHQLLWPTKPTNQLPFYAFDTIAQANRIYFCLQIDCTPTETKRNEVIVKKENAGEECSK